MLVSKHSDLCFNIDWVLVKPPSTIINLGVRFDQSLTFAYHISSHIKTAFFTFVTLLDPYSPRHRFIKDAQTVAYAFISSLLDYCNALFTSLPTKTFSRLHYVQNVVGKVHTRTKLSAHVSSAFFKLYWLPISYHIQYKTLFTYKALHDYAPGYLTELILTYTPTHVLWSSSSSVLPTPRFRLSFMGGMSFIGHYGINFHRASKKSPPFPPSKHNSNPIFSLSARTPWL